MLIAVKSVVAPEFVRALEEGRRRMDRLKIERPIALVLQNAPDPAMRHREALPLGSASRRSALRLWNLADDELEMRVRVNAYEMEPRGATGDVDAAARRLESMLEVLGDRLAGVVLAGRKQVAPMATAVGARLDVRWNEARWIGARRLGLVPHPSGRCRMYNDPGVRRGAAEVLWRLAQDHASGREAAPA